MSDACMPIHCPVPSECLQYVRTPATPQPPGPPVMAGPRRVASAVASAASASLPGAAPSAGCSVPGWARAREERADSAPRRPLDCSCTTRCTAVPTSRAIWGTLSEVTAGREKEGGAEGELRAEGERRAEEELGWRAPASQADGWECMGKLGHMHNNRSHPFRGGAPSRVPTTRAAHLRRSAGRPSCLQTGPAAAAAQRGPRPAVPSAGGPCWTAQETCPLAGVPPGLRRAGQRRLPRHPAAAAAGQVRPAGHAGPPRHPQGRAEWPLAQPGPGDPRAGAQLAAALPLPLPGPPPRLPRRRQQGHRPWHRQQGRQACQPCLLRRPCRPAD